MTADQTASFIYLVLLGAVIALSHLVANRGNLGRVARQAALWGLIFLGAVAVVGLWPTIRDTVMPRQTVLADGRQITVPMSADGHFYLILDLNGVPVRFVVDTALVEICPRRLAGITQQHFAANIIDRFQRALPYMTLCGLLRLLRELHKIMAQQVQRHRVGDHPAVGQELQPKG